MSGSVPLETMEAAARVCAANEKDIEMTNQVQTIDESKDVQTVTNGADAMTAIFERAAFDQNFPLDRLEKMMEMQERWEARNATKNFNEAISQAKAKIPVILKTKEVDFTTAKGRTNYRYEDFATIADIVDPIISEFGLSYRFRTGEENGKVSVTCILSHKDGHFEETTISAGRDDTGNKNAIQSIGSTITYLQRYTLKSALGIAVSNDTDAKQPEAPDEPITDEQRDDLLELIKATETDVSKFCKFLKINSVAEMPMSKLGKAEAMLNAKKAKEVQS